ncbi:MAG: glycosyltransferase, partial [Calditrichales bacterium]|nr:glycosyltransferase [Calditrichales bacterium]
SVLGADIGGIPELIEENKTGLLFKSGNESNLSEKIDLFFKELNDNKLGNNTIRFAREQFSSKLYYTKLMEIYNTMTKGV